jgi:hypothetical protein
VTALLRGMAGLLLWGAAFVTLYALSGLGCALGWDRQSLGGFGLFKIVLVGAWAAFIMAHLALLAALLSRRLRASDSFWRQLERTVAVVGLAATVWTIVPAGTVSATCEHHATQWLGIAAAVGGNS